MRRRFDSVLCSSVRSGQCVRSPRLGGALLLALVGFFSAPCAAQISGRVIGSQKQTLPDVAVRAWQTATFLGEVTTDANGRFAIEIDPAAVRRLTFHYPGFETAIIHDFAQPDLVVEMATSPVRVEGIEAAVDQGGDSRCRIEDNPEAHAIWRAAAEKVSRDTGYRSVAYGSRTLTESKTLRAFDSGVEVQGRARGASRVGATESPTPGRHLLFETRVRERGYARAPLQDGATYQWFRYPSLDGTKAYHFATDGFAELNRLDILSIDGELQSLRFCTPEGRPGIQGALRLKEGEFESAEWVFTDERGEPLQAGGEVYFSTIRDSAGGVHLIASRGLRWAADPYRDGFFTVGSTLFGRWLIGLSAELPPHPDVGGRW